MVEVRSKFIAEKIRAADSTLTTGHRICLVANELLGAKSVSLALVVDHAYSPVAATDSLGTLPDDRGRLCAGRFPATVGRLIPVRTH